MQKPKVHAPEKNWNTSPDPDLEIDFMDLADVDQVRKIEKASFRSPWPRSYFVQEINRNPISYSIVLRDPSKNVVAFCIAWIMNDVLHINNIATDPKCRKRGYAQTVLESMLDLGRSYGCIEVKLEVRVSNEPAIRLYERLGFQVVSKISKHYDDNGEDAFVYARAL
ncbi:MAG: ribosomal-protein-alanine N-acetyltransferase [Acidobacteria bacterium]|nr:MAG: ribosomal-protein-alanine N-acetyltransferase [Acidobacteriota bacterium]